MKKNNTTSSESEAGTARTRKGGWPVTIGLDLGDKSSRYCVLGDKGEVLSEGAVATTHKAMTAKFAGMRRCRVAREVGTHSPWSSVSGNGGDSVRF